MFLVINGVFGRHMGVRAKSKMISGRVFSGEMASLTSGEIANGERNHLSIDDEVADIAQIYYFHDSPTMRFRWKYTTHSANGPPY